ncbi:MAG: hypothetical protein L3J97_03695 [Thermoplasmata archaeon]|nr:hypothetical protein [Thermoplasmata archaeon]
MAPFRGTDEVLDHEIETLEAMARLRVRRAARDLRDLDRDLSELRRERARRRAAASVPVLESTAETPESA